MTALQTMFALANLTSKESRIAYMVSRGMSNKEIATEVGVLEKTVKFHLTNTYKKLNVKSRAQLIVKCIPHLTFVDIETAETNIE